MEQNPSAPLGHGSLPGRGRSGAPVAPATSRTGAAQESKPAPRPAFQCFDEGLAGTASTLLSLTHDAVLVLEADGQPAFHNRRTAQLLALSEGTPPPALVTGRLRALATPACPSGSCTTTLACADGSSRQVALKWSALPHCPGTLFVIHDLSSLEQTRLALEASNRELKAMARRLFSAQEDERRAISRDLHDDIGQTITAIRMSAHAAMDEDDRQRRRGDLQNLLDLADQAVARLRDLSMLLRPPQLDALGLESALRWQAELILKKTGIELELDIQPLGRRLPAETEQACFRIAQEALTNIVRHAGASHASLTLRGIDDDAICLVVSDDGAGFQPGLQTGLGLVVMRERAESAGGILQLNTQPGEGTLIHCTLPCTPPE